MTLMKFLKERNVNMINIHYFLIRNVMKNVQLILIIDKDFLNIVIAQVNGI